MKILFILFACLYFNCEQIIDDNTIIENKGKTKVGENLFLKKIIIDGDRIYMIVDENDKLISSGISTSYTVKNGKTSTTHSNTLFQ